MSHKGTNLSILLFFTAWRRSSCCKRCYTQFTP